MVQAKRLVAPPFARPHPLHQDSEQVATSLDLHTRKYANEFQEMIDAVKARKKTRLDKLKVDDENIETKENEAELNSNNIEG